MGTPTFGWPPVVLACAATVLAGCTTGGQQQDATPIALPAPEIPARTRASEVIGRWGYAAYHKPEDRARTEANARGLVMLHFAACSVQPRCERGVDRQLHAARTLSALFYRSDDMLSRLRLLARLSILEACLR